MINSLDSKWNPFAEPNIPTELMTHAIWMPKNTETFLNLSNEHSQPGDYPRLTGDWLIGKRSGSADL